MNSLAIVAALLAAFSAWNLAKIIKPPPKRLSNRVAPYTQLNRSKLGKGADISSIGFFDLEKEKTALGRVFGPMGQSLADSLSSVLDAGDDDYLRLRLRQAGFLDTSPAQYRLRQLTYFRCNGFAFPKYIINSCWFFRWRFLGNKYLAKSNS